MKKSSILLLVLCSFFILNFPLTLPAQAYSGKVDPVIVAWNKPVRLPDKSSSKQTQAAVLLGMGEVESALKIYQKLYREAVDKQDYKSAARFASGVANCFVKMGVGDESVKYAKKAAEHARKAGAIIEEAQYLVNLANIYYKFGKLQKAYQVASEAEKIARENNDAMKLQSAYVAKAIIDRERGDKKGYLEYRGKAVKLVESTMKKWQKESNPFMYYIEGWKLIGIYLQLTEYEKAYQATDDLLSYCKKNNLKVNVPLLLRSRGSILAMMGRYAPAIEDYEEAIKLYQELNQETMTAALHQDLAHTYNLLGRYEKAIYHLKKSIEISSLMPDNELNMSVLHYRLATNYMDLGRYDWARENLEKSKNLLKKIDEFHFRSLVEYIVARIDFETKPPEEALKSINKCIDVCKKSGSSHLYLAYQLRGKILQSMDKKEEAVQSFEQAVREVEKDPYHPHFKRSNAFLSLGEAQLEAGLKKQAVASLAAAIKEAEKVKIEDIPYYVFNRNQVVARANMLMGKTDRALAYYRKSLDLLEKVYSPAYRWRLYFHLGETFEKQGDVKKALEAYVQAEKAIEEQRSSLNLPEFKMSFSGVRSRFYEISVEQVYDKLINLLIKTGQDKKAFEYSERARSRSLLDMLNRGGVEFGTGPGNQLAKQQAELEKEIDQLSALIYQKQDGLRGSADYGDLKELRGRIGSLKKRYSEILVKLKMEDPHLGNLVSADPFPTSQIQKVLDNKSAFIQYNLTGDQLVIFVVKKDHLIARRVKVSELKLRNLSLRFRRLLKTPGSGNTRRIDRVSSQLSNYLIKPVKNDLKGIKNLVIVPNSFLHFIPFEVLKLDGKTDLIDKFVVQYVPSASVGVLIFNKGSSEYDSLSAFALADLSPTTYGIRWDKLPGTKKEVEVISNYFKHKKLVSGKNMTRKSVDEASGKAEVIHFATHGLFDLQAPLFSGLVLADDLLTAKDIFSMKIDACLVVLSACQTGLGKIRGGDEIVGLSRAFFYAGAPSVVVSLWSVSDESTVELMSHFYANLKNHPRGEALRLAKLKVRETRPHPFNWAAFILIGDYR